MKTMKAPPHSLADVPPTCLSDEAAEGGATWATVVSKYLVLPHSTPNQPSNIAVPKDWQREWDRTAQENLSDKDIVRSLQIPYLHPALVSNPNVPQDMLDAVISTYIEKVCTNEQGELRTPAPGAPKWQTEEFWGDIVLCFAADNHNLSVPSSVALQHTFPAHTQPDVHIGLLNNPATPKNVCEEIILEGTLEVWVAALKSPTLDEDAKTLAFLMLHPCG